MSKVAIVGDPSGTGTFTISAPNGNTDRTLVLPDEAGTIITTAGVPASAMPAGSVIQVATSGYFGGSGTTSSSAVATGRYVDITPLFSTSTIVVWMSSSVYKNGGYGFFYIYRNGSVMISQNQMGNALTFYVPTTMMGYDVPNTTSSVRYEIYISNNSGTDIYLPPGSADTTRLVAMEIKG